MRELTEFEENLVELVQFLSAGNTIQKGLSVREIKKFLVTKIRERGNRTPLECIEDQGKQFLNELRIYINELND